MALTIDSNKTSLTYAEESSLKTLPGNPTWYPLEPNTYSNFGGSVKTTQREPITATRQRFKGTVTDLDVTAGFNTDVTQDNITRLLQGFFFAHAREKFKTKPFHGTDVTITGVTAAADPTDATFTAAAGLGGVKTGSLCLSSGFGNGANNALTRVSGAAAGALSVEPYSPGATPVPLVAEAAPPADAKLEVVGFALSGDVLLYGPGSTFNGATVVQPLLSSAADVDFTTLGLIPGEWLYLGDATDDLSDTGDSEFNFVSGTTRNRGYCRIASISAHQLVFDLSIGSDGWALGSGAGQSCEIGASGYVSLYFGTVIRNEPSPADIVRTTYTLQRYLGQNASAEDMLEYVNGAVPNELSITVPSNSKLTADLSFVGMDTQQEQSAQLAGTYEALKAASPFNTSQDMYAMLLYLIDATVTTQKPLFGYATDEKITVNNNTKPNKAVGVVGAFEANVGNFDVSGTLSCYFDDISALQAVRNNSDVGLVNIFAKQGGGFVLDMPLLTIELPGAKVEKDKPIMADISQSAAPGVNNYTLLYNQFAYLPASALADYSD
jgi:hypothetical protein